MGVVAFSLLLEEILCRKEGIRFLPKTIELETKIIERDSSLKGRT
jgi:LacI family transcriptional regulator